MLSARECTFLSVAVGAVALAWVAGRRSSKVFAAAASVGSTTSAKTAFAAHRSYPPGLLIITGASKGIGLATAKLFVEAGWRVLNLSRSPCPLAGVTNRKTDLADQGWAEDFAEWLKNQPELAVEARICLVHNAAVMVRDTALDSDAKQMATAFAVNVIAPASLNRVLSPWMGAGSSILYIGSTLSEKGIPGSASYVSSKHAIAGLMKVTAQDLKGRCVHTACICPGFTATEMLVDHLGDNPDAQERILGMQTMGRLIETSEIAEFIYFCGENPVVNGAVLHANLGQVER